MPDNTVQIRVTAELSAINNQMSALSRQIETSFASGAAGAQRMNAAIPPLTWSVQEVNQELLNNTQSVRLLASEFGVALPRAVSSAVSQMIPAINMIGPALVGAFAVEEVWKFGKAAYDMMHELQGETKELAEDWKAVIKEQQKLLTDPHTKEDAVRNLNDTNKALSQTHARVVDLTNQLNKVPTGAAILAAEIASLLSQAEADERRLQALAVEQQNALTKFAVENNKQLAKTAKKGADERRREVEEETRNQEFIIEQLNKWAEEDQAARVRRANAAEAIWRTEFEAERRNARLMIELNGEREEGIKGFGKALRVIPVDIQFLNHALDGAVPKFRAWAAAIQQVENAYHGLTQAKAEGAAADVASFFGAIAGRKAQADIEGAFYLAEGAYDISRGIWPPNPGLWARGAGEISAGIEMLKVGGGGGGSRGGGGGGSRGGGGGGSYGDSSSRSEQGVERVGGGSTGGGGSSSGGQTILQIQGKLSGNGAQQMAAWLGMGSAIGLYKLTSQGSSGVNAPLY